MKLRKYFGFPPKYLIRDLNVSGWKTASITPQTANVG